MNVLKRRALILTLLVLCLFGLTILGASAAVDTAATGTTTQETGSVASATVTVGTAEQPQVYYYTDLATAIAEADDGTTVTLLSNVNVTSAITVEGKTLTIEGANADIQLTAPAKTLMFNIGNNAHVTFKNIKVTTDRFVTFRQNTTDASASLTLDAGAHVTNIDLAVDNDVLIYNSLATANITINIKANASVIVKSLTEVAPAYATILSSNGVSTTLNVWGTLKNIATTPDGKNAQVYVVKGATQNGTLNVYDGAIIEGTSDNTTHNGKYSGIVYYSQGVKNAINIYGGTITVHGATGLAFTGDGSSTTVNISGGTINNAEAEYPMFFGASLTATISGTDTVKPKFNVTQKLLASGTLNTAVNAFNKEDCSIASTLGFAVLLESNKTAYTGLTSAVRDAIAAEDTLYLLSNITSNVSFYGTNADLTTRGILENKKLTITSFGDTKFTWTTTIKANGVLFYIGSNTHLIIDNVIINAGCRFMRFESNGDGDGTFMKVDILSKAEIYATPNTDGNFIYYGADRVLTMNIEDGAIIQRKGDCSLAKANLIVLNNEFAEGSVINIKGKLSDITNFTGTGARESNLFVHKYKNLTVNIYSTAVLEVALTKTDASATINATRFSNSGTTHFENDTAAVYMGAPVRLGTTVGGNLGTVYFETLAEAIAAIPANGKGTITLLANTTVSATLTIANKEVTLTGADGVTLTMSGSPAFILGNNSHLVIDDLKVVATKAFVSVENTDTSSTATLDLESGAEIEITNYTSGYFLQAAMSANTGKLTVNIKNGSSLKLLSNGTVSAASQGLFRFYSNSSNAYSVASGSTINVDGTIIYGLTFNATGTASTNRAAMFKMSDNTVTLNFTSNANVELAHVNALPGTWNAIACIESKASVNIDGGTFKIPAGCGLIGYNGENFAGTYVIKNNPSFTTVDGWLIYDYCKATDGVLTGWQKSAVTFQNVDLGATNISYNGRMTKVTLVNVGFKDEATAIANYATVRVGDDVTKGYYNNFATAYSAAKSGDTIYVLANISIGTTYVENKVITIKGVGDVTLSNSSTDTSTVLFDLFDGADLTFSTINLNITNRFLRSRSGAAKVTFASGAKVTSTNAIFFYANSYALDVTTTMVFDFQAGSEIDSKATNLIYHNQTVDTNGDGVGDASRVLNATIKIAGKLKLSSTADGAIAKDSNQNGTYIVYYDATTANVTCSAARWFYLHENNSVVYVTGFATVADADAFANTAGLSIRSGDKIGEGVWLPYTGFTGQMHQVAIDVLPEGEDTIYLLKDIASIYATLHFRDRETIKIVGAKADGTTAVINFQGDAQRAQIYDGTELIIDGVTLNANTKAGVANVATDQTYGRIFQINGGKLTLKNLTLNANGNNEYAPINIVSATKSTVTLEKCTVNAGNDLFRVGGSSAVLTSIVVDNSTLNVTADTTLDYRNSNADTRVDFTVKNQTVWNSAAGLYVYGAKGLINVTFENSTFTGGSTFSVDSLAQPADGKGLTDADGEGNYALAITAKNITVTTSGYFLRLNSASCVGNVSLNIVGTKTGTGASATHSNVINGALANLSGANDRVQIRATGLKVDGAVYSTVYMVGSTNTIDMEFEGITFTTSGNNGRTFNSESSATHTNLIIKIKDANVTAGDKSTYSNEINAKQIGFLLRGFKNVKLELTGIISTRLPQDVRGAFIDVQTPTAANTANGVSITLTDIAIDNHTYVISNSTLACDVTATVANVNATTTDGFLNVHKDSTHTLNATVTNSTYTVGGKTYNASGKYAITGATLTLSGYADQATADTVALKAGYVVRTTADGATNSVYYRAFNAAAINHATADATKAGTITVLTNLTGITFTLGDGADDANFKPYDLTIVGVKLLGATAWPTLSPSGADAIKMYDGSDLTFRNITVQASFRWVRVYNTKGVADDCNLIFGENSTALMNTASSTTEDFIYAQNASYTNFIVEQGAAIRMTQTAATGRKTVIAFNGAYGDVIIRGTVDANITTVDGATNIFFCQMGSTSGNLIIESTAVVNFKVTGGYGNSYFVGSTGLAIIDAAAKINGAVLNDTTAKAIGFNIRNNAADGKTDFYANIIGALAYKHMSDVSTFTLLGNANIYVYETIKDKEFTITSLEGNKFTLTLPSTYAAFNLGANTKLTLTNLTLNLGGNRFARVDGNTHVIFGDGATVNCSAGIFIYSNSNGAFDITATYDFQAGSVINWTSASGSMIYHDGTKDLNNDGDVKDSGEKQKLTLNVYISGEMNISSTSTGAITYDKNDNSSYIVWIDFTTAKITCTATYWFYHCEQRSPVYMTGLDTIEEYDAVARKTSLAVRSGAKIGEGVWVPYTGFRGQINQVAIDVLPEGENTLYLLEDITSINSTMHYKDRDSFRIVSNKADGTQATIKFQGDAYRFRVYSGSPLTLDNVNIITGKGSSDVGKLFQFHNGTSAVPATLILTNGSTLTSKVPASALNFADTTALVKIESTDTLTNLDTFAASFALKLRVVTETGANYYNTLSLHAANTATANATKAGTVTALANFSVAKEYFVLGDGKDDANFTTYDLTVTGIKVGSATEYPTITVSQDGIRLYDGSDITFTNVNIYSNNRWLRIYNTKCTDPCDIVFGENVTASQKTATSNDDFILVTSGSYTNITVEEGATLTRTLTAANTTATKKMFSADSLHGTITIAGTVTFNAACTLNSNNKPTPAYLFATNGADSAVVIKSTANVNFSATGESAGSSILTGDTYVTIEDGATVNGTTYESARLAAQQFGLAAEYTDKADGKVYYVNNVAYALKNAKDKTAVTLLRDASFSGVISLEGRELTIASIPGSTYTLTHTSGWAAFWLLSDSKLTLENITLTLQVNADCNGRFARIDGSSHVIFGNGATVNTAGAIFIYNNGNGLAGGYAYTIDFLAGSVINATGSMSNGLIYHNSESAANADVTVNIAGTINIPTASPITKDADANGRYVVNYDASTADVTCGAPIWFSHNTLVYFKNLEGDAVTEFALACGLAVRYGDVYASGIYTPMLDLIPEGGSAIIYILQDVNTFCTAAFSNKTVTVKSDPAAGINYYTITSVSTAPIFAIGENAHLILDNINIVSGSFIRFETVNADNATITVDFNSGATVTASKSSSYPNFIYATGAQNKPVLLTINVNSGAKLGRPANTWAVTGSDRNCYLFNLNNFGTNLLAGSAINVAGTLEELTSFEGTGARRSSIILANKDADLTVNITPGAVFNYNAGTHGINADEGMINTIGAVNISGGAFNLSGETDMLAPFWLASTSVYTFTGNIVFNAPYLTEFFYSYSSEAKVYFDNATFRTNVPANIKLEYANRNLPAITVVNSTFTSEHVANILNATVTLDNGNALSGRYDLASAIALVESGATIYLQADSIISSTIVLDGKAITIAPIGDEAMKLALYSNTVGKMFVLKNGASLTLNNLTVTITADTVDRKVETAGSFITVDEAEPTGAVKVNLNNINLTASASIPFYFGGNSVVEVAINGGSYVGEGMFAIGYYASESEKGKGDGVDVTSNATVTVTVTGTEDEHVLLRRTEAGDQNAIIFINFAGKAANHKNQVVFNLTHADLGREGAASYTHPIYLRGAAALTLNQTCGQFYTGGWLIGGQSGAALYVTLTDVDMTYTGTSYSLRPYGVSGAGSYFKMVGGSVNANRVSDSGYVLSFNADIAVSFTGTTFNVATNATLFSREGGIAPSIVLDGCTFNMAGKIVTTSKTMNVMVKGETKVLEGEELVAITPEIALARGFIVELEGTSVYASNLFTAFVAEAKAETNKVLIHGNLALSYPIYVTNQNITFAGVGENITITVGVGLRPFYIENNSTVTFKDLTINAYRFFTFNASNSDVLTTVTLENTDVIVPDYSKDIDALIYKGHTVGKAVLNIDANSSIVMNSSAAPATDKTIYALIAIYNGEGATVNVWGTIKNLMKTSESQNAQVISIKGAKNNATVNIYDGAVLEGTSSYGKYTGTHGGSYCGIIYFSQGTNTLNIEGGTITVHGVTGLAYTGTTATINISGNAVINNVDAQYAMFFGDNQTAHITGTADAKPVINTPAKLIASGTAYAYNFFTEEEYATLAKTLGFTVLLASSNTACTTWNATMRDLMAAEETLYLLNNVSSSSNFSAASLTDTKLTITSYGNAKYTWTTTIRANAVLFFVASNTHLIIDNVIMDVAARFMRFESDGETGTSMKVDILGGAEIYALPGGDGNFIYYSADRVLTMNIEEGAIIQRKGDSDAATGHLINLGANFAEGSVINIKGKISDITNYTGTATRGGNLFAVPGANVVVNIYNTAELEMALTTETGKIGVVRFAPAGLVYFKNFAEGTDYDKLATSYGLALRADATATADTAYARNLSAQLIALAESNGTIYALNDFVLSANFTIDNKNVVIEPLRDGITMTQSATITLINDSSLTVKNLAIVSSACFINSSTVTNGNTIKLENVKVTTSAKKDTDFITVTNSKTAIEITNFEFLATANRVRVIRATTNGVVTSLKVTNAKLNTALFRVENTTGVIGSAEAPATLTDVTFVADEVIGSAFMYAYNAAAYVDIFGGSYTGQFIYGGDNNTNTLQIRVNPIGDKTTTISTLTPSTTSQYTALIHLNPAAAADVTLSFRNATLSDVGGKSALIRVMKTTRLTIYVDNTTLNANSFLNAYHYCTVYGHFNSAAEAKTFGFNVRLGENVGKGVYYYFVNHAFEAAKDGDTIYLMGNASSINVGIDDTLFTKKVHVTSDGGPYTVTTLTGIAFYLGDGAELKFTNVIYDLSNRLARIDGSCSIIFGAGSVMNHKNTIFIYNNGQESVKGAKYTIDIQAGSTINATTALANGLIYHNGANTADNEITVKIAGKINMPTKSYIVRSVDKNGRYHIYYDASTADVTVGQDLWFSNVFLGNRDGAMADDVLWATGFKSHAEADEFGYKHVGAYFRTYDANPEAEYEYSFVLHTQFVDVITGHLTSYGGEVMILRSTQSVYATRHFDFGGVLTFKSYNGAYFGAQDGAYRFRIKNGTTVILDGVEFRTKGGAFMLHQGTAANPSELKLINGAKITSTGEIAGATMISFNDKDCANTNLYVDETSSITLSGANTGSLNMIYVNAGWSGTMTIKGTLTTTAAPTGYVVLINIGGADSTGNIILDGATINLNSTKGTEAIMIDADASNNTGTITIKNATLNNNAVCTGTTAFVRTGELVNIEIYTKGLTANYNPTNSYKYSAPFFGTGLVYFKDVTGAEADAMAVELGTGVRYGDVYSAALSTRMVNLIPVGGSGEIHFLCPAYVPTHITIFNRHVTLVGVENNTAYNYFYTPTANYMFYIQNVGSLIFKNMNITGARPLINYQAIDAATVAQADRDILISFIASNVKITGSSVLINSNAHHGSVANKKCDTITLLIDKDTTIDYTANSSGTSTDIYCFSFNHNTHPTVYVNIEGTVNFACVGATVRDVFFIRDNNPSTTTVNIAQTANISLRVTSTVGGHKFFASATGGSETSNKMNIHLDAITDENGLTIDNFTLFSLYRATNMYDLCITATTDKWTAELQKLIAVSAGAEVPAIGAYAEIDGTYYYSSIIGHSLISKITDEATVYILNDCTTSREIVLEGMKITFKSFGDKIYTVTSNYISVSPIFKVLGDVHLVFENVTFVAGRFARIDDVTKVDSYFTVDVNKGASLIASDPAKDPNFIYGSTTVDRLVTININEGGYMGRPAYDWASGTAFILNFDSLKLSPGSSVNVAGTMEDLINFTATSGTRKSAIILNRTDSDLTVNILPGAVFNYNGGRHSVNQGQGLINVAGKINISGGTFNISGTAEVLPIFWLNTGASMYLTGEITINAPALKQLCYTYTAPTTITVDGATILGAAADNAVTTSTTNYPTLKVIDATFGNENLASMFGGTACVGELDAENPLAHRYDFSSAVKIALSKGIELVTITGNTIMNEGIVLNGQTLKLICSAQTAPTVYASPNVLKAFTLQNGATLEIRNINFNLRANTVDRQVETAGVFITADETAPNGANNVLLDNVTLTAGYGIPFYFGGNTIVNLTINGGSYTGGGMFAIGYTATESATGKGDGVDVFSNATVRVTITGTHDKHVVIKRTVGGDQNSIIFVNQTGSALENKGKVAFTMTHVDLDSSATSYPMYLRTRAALTVDYTCGKMSSTAWLFASQANCAFYANFTDVDMTSTRTSYIARPYGAAGSGSYVNITGGTITGDKVKATEYMLSFNNDIDVTLTGVKIVSALGAPIFGSETQTGLSITISDLDISEAGALVHATKTPVLHNNGIVMENDAAAIAKGLVFRVGPEGGKYFHSIASAVAAVADGGVIYVLANSTEPSSNIALNKYITFELVNAPATGYTITHTGTGNLFLVTDSTEAAPARLVISNMKFVSTVATGAIFATAGNGYAIIELTNCEVSTSKGGVFNFSGKSSAVVTINGGYFKAYYRPVYTVEESAVQFTASDVTFEGLGAGNDGTIFFFDNTNGNTGAVAFRFTDCKIVNTTSSGHGIYAMNTSKVDLDMTNCTINVRGWCLSSQSNTTWHANLTNVSFTTNSNNHAVRLYGTAGSYLNVMGGTFHQTGTTSTNEGVLSVGNSIVLNFFDGYIESDEIACITALTATVQINIYGGTFRYTGNKDGGAPVALPSRGMITVNGGNFITESSVGPVFSNVANTANSLILNAFNAYGNANLITNLGAGTPTADHDAYGRTSLNTIVMTTGATPILTEGAAGLGFKASLSANAYAYLTGLAVDRVVKFGMLVIPTEELDETRFNHYGFQTAGLVEGVDYFDIKAGESDVTLADDGCVVVKLALTGISEADYSTAYSVVFYASYDVNFELNGELISTHNVYQYADYERSENSRSLAQVARAAYNDTSATQDSYYVNPVENTALYSHYTTEELAQLAIFCGGDTTQQTLDIFLVAGGSNAVGNTVYGDAFASAFDQNSISSNVFYSGMICDYAAQTYGATTLNFVTSKYTAIGSTPALGMGWLADSMGPEVGMAKELSKYYNSESGKYAAIMKYAFNNVSLVDDAEFCNNFMQMVADQIADYQSQGYKVNVVGLYWLQGEADVENVSAYAAAFNTMVSNVRSNLSSITGADLSSMPVVAGEIANFLGFNTADAQTAFVTMQNTLTSVNGVKVDATSKYVADANGIFVNPADVLATGERVAATLITSGTNTLDPDVSAEITVPTIENTNEIYDAEGNPFTDAEGNVIGFTSLVMAAAKAPAGSTIKLTADQTVYTSIQFVNSDNLTIDGNGKVITVNGNEAGIILQNANVTLNNFKLDHKGNAVAIMVDETSSVVIDGNSSIIAESTAIELTGRDSMLTVKNGEFQTRSANNYADAIIRTVSAHVTIEGGTFVAAAGGSCVYIGKLASDKLTVNIKGGTFTTIDVVAPVMTADGLQEVDANGVALTATVQAIAFVNEYVLAILVISPDAVVNSSIVSNNAGIGQN